MKLIDPIIPYYTSKNSHNGILIFCIFCVFLKENYLHKCQKFAASIKSTICCAVSFTGNLKHFQSFYNGKGCVQSATFLSKVIQFENSKYIHCATPQFRFNCKLCPKT